MRLGDKAFDTLLPAHIDDDMFVVALQCLPFAVVCEDIFRWCLAPFACLEVDVEAFVIVEPAATEGMAKQGTFFLPPPSQRYEPPAYSPSEVEGYTFKGWYANESRTSLYTFGEEVTEDITLYAKWEINKYKVTFKSTISDVITGI